MNSFIEGLKSRWERRPFVWRESDAATAGRLPRSGVVLVLAPHPDDPESVVVTCRLLMRSGCDIRYLIVSLSPAGVEDAYAGSQTDVSMRSLEERKAAIRRREQNQSAKEFGLDEKKVNFLALDESKLDSPENKGELRRQLESTAPDIVIMPTGRDTNRTHQWVYEVFRECAKDIAEKNGKTICAFYNEDPKTTEIRRDLFVFFGEETAAWKRRLLRFHDSQQQRNLHTRGIGFDQRILDVNHACGRRFLLSANLQGGAGNYAEGFELELFQPGFGDPRLRSGAGARE